MSDDSLRVLFALKSGFREIVNYINRTAFIDDYHLNIVTDMYQHVLQKKRCIHKTDEKEDLSP